MKKELNTTKMWPDEFNNCCVAYLLQTDAKLNIIFSNQPNGEKNECLKAHRWIQNLVPLSQQTKAVQRHDNLDTVFSIWTFNSDWWGLLTFVNFPAITQNSNIIKCLCDVIMGADSSPRSVKTPISKCLSLLTAAFFLSTSKYVEGFQEGIGFSQWWRQKKNRCR